MTITADELAKVHAFYETEGQAYSVLAEDLGREVQRLRNEEKQATEDAYRDELARIQYDAECAYALAEHGAELSGWDETTEFQRGVTTAGVDAILEKLAADGRLIPVGGESSADVWDEGFEAGFSYAGNQTTTFGAFIDPPLNPYLQESTEPESWDTWQEVPHGVEYIGHDPSHTTMWRNTREGTRMIYVGFSRWICCGMSESMLNEYAPFISADKEFE